MAKSIRMRNKATGKVKQGYYGFSWTSFFFSGIPAIMRGNVGMGLLILAASMVTCVTVTGTPCCKKSHRR